MKKALFLLAALLTAACSQNRSQNEPIYVYRGYDDQGCNYYNGVCYRAPRRYVVRSSYEQPQQQVVYNQQPVPKVGTGEHCSATIFKEKPAPAVIEQPAPVRVVQPVRVIQPVVQQIPVIQQVPVVQQAAPCTTAGNTGCQPIVKTTRQPVEVLYKKVTTKTVFEPKTTQEVSYEKEPYNGQLPCTNCQVTTTPAEPIVETQTVPAQETLIIPERQTVSEIEMDPAEVK